LLPRTPTPPSEELSLANLALMSMPGNSSMRILRHGNQNSRLILSLLVNTTSLKTVNTMMRIFSLAHLNVLLQGLPPQ
jgi:hypothetical protein